MIIYNITVTVEEDIKEDWLHWMQNKHIPKIMNCGIFIKSKIKRVITQADSENTFAIAYSCLSMKDLHQYQINFSDNFQKEHTSRYGEKTVAFRTIMEVIEEF